LISELAEQLNKSRADIVREAVAGFVLLKDLGEDLAPPAKRKEIRPCSE
jgi:predicted transcriptional regulator